MPADSPSCVREPDHAAGELMPGGDHGIETRERIEALEAEQRLARQAPDRGPREPVLEVLAEQQAIALERARDRQPGLELVDEPEAAAEARDQVVGLGHPFVRAALGADLRDTG
jgi:hypothetical protein